MQFKVEEVALADIRVNTGGFTNCRKVFTPVDELKASIAREGLLNPPIVWRTADGALILVSGHQRLTAIQELARDTPGTFESLSVSIYEGDLAGALAVNVTENLQRVDLNPADKSEGVYRLVRQYGTQEKVAEALGKSQPWVSHQCRIAGNLLPPAMHALRDGLISVAQALVLASHVDPAGNPIADAQLRALEAMLTGAAAGKAARKRSYRSKQDVEALRQRISDAGDFPPDLSDERLQALRDMVKWFFLEIEEAELLGEDQPQAIAVP